MDPRVSQPGQEAEVAETAETDTSPHHPIRSIGLEHPRPAQQDPPQLGPIDHLHRLGHQPIPPRTSRPPVAVIRIVEHRHERLDQLRPSRRAPPVTTNQSAMHSLSPQGIADTSPFGRAGKRTHDTVGVIAILVETVTDEFGQRDADRESPSRPHEPSPDPHGQQIHGVNMKIVKRHGRPLRPHADL
jgi:hypothetical protein